MRLQGLRYYTGATLSPFTAFLVLRGLKTLELRVQRHSESALRVARLLREHPAVADVFYPGLADTAGAEIARRQQSAGGGLVAFELKGGLDAGRRLLNGLKLARIAVSLGDPETLIQHPASMTHASYSAEDRERYGLSEGLLRLSVGLETPDDILADLKQGLDRACSRVGGRRAGAVSGRGVRGVAAPGQPFSLAQPIPGRAPRHALAQRAVQAGQAAQRAGGVSDPARPRRSPRPASRRRRWARG